MRSPNSSSTFKREFLKKWLLALQLCKNNNKKNCHRSNVVERKNTIKLAAEIAMAAARNGATCWSRALITKHSSFLHHQMSPAPGRDRKRARCKRIVKRSRRSAAAAAVVRRKTEVLKKLVPGGEFIDDEVSLIRETLDYVESLRAQVDVMRRLARATYSDTHRSSRHG